MWKILRQIARVGIPTESAPTPAETEAGAAGRIQQELLDILGQALAIRHVDAGSCNACELEIHALANPYYNLEGLGIKFVASPRHADMLLVTGPVTRNMEQALRRLRCDARAAAGGRRGRSRGLRRHVRGELRQLRRRREDPAGGRDGAGLPAAAAGDHARHPGGGAASPLGLLAVG